MSRNAILYVKRGQIIQTDYNFLSEEIDPSKNKKFLGFVIKAYLAGTNLDLLRNRITEYDTLVSHNQVDRKDIYSFRTFEQLDEYVQQYNNVKSTREIKRGIKKEAEIITDTEDVFIVCPYSWRKLLINFRRCLLMGY
jgi:hypothetical protein